MMSVLFPIVFTYCPRAVGMIQKAFENIFCSSKMSLRFSFNLAEVDFARLELIRSWHSTALWKRKDTAFSCWGMFELNNALQGVIIFHTLFLYSYSYSYLYNISYTSILYVGLMSHTMSHWYFQFDNPQQILSCFQARFLHSLHILHFIGIVAAA